MTRNRTSLALALIAAYFIALPVIRFSVGIVHAGQFVYRIGDYVPVLLFFCIVSLAGTVLFAAIVQRDGGRWWTAAPLAALLLLLAVFGPLHRSSDVSLVATILLAPAVLLLLAAFPLRQGSLEWFGAIEAGFISFLGLLWAYGLLFAQPLPETVRIHSPSLSEFTGTVYVYAGLPMLGVLLLVFALRYRQHSVTVARRPARERSA